MKKIILGLVFIIGVIGYYFINDYGIDEKEQDNTEVVVAKKSEFALTSQKEKSAVLEEFNEVLKNDKQVEIYPKAIEFSKKQVLCILNKTCTQNSEDRFYDPKLDPANTILRKSLEVINKVTLIDSEKLLDITDEHLLNVIKVDHPSSSFLAYTLLLRKGKDSFKKTVELAKSFTGDSAINYLRQYKSHVLSSDKEFSDIRNELILDYLNNGDNYTTHQLVKEISKHKLSDEMIESVITKTCLKLKPFNTESKKISKVQLTKLARSINLSSVCQ